MILALSVFGVSSALACGPFYPHSLLSSGSGALLTGPYADFGRELDRVDVAVPAGVVGNNTGRDAAEAAYAEQELGKSQPALEAVARFRRDLERVKQGRGTVPAVPDGLPEAWREYFEGVRLLALKDTEAALERFHHVLEMPPEESRSRGLWALHNVAVMERNPKVADAARQRVVAGQADLLGVTASAIGWDARALWDLGQPVEAIEGYVVQHKAGDPTAEPSLRWLLPQVLADSALRDAVAANPQATTVMMAWMAAGGGSDQERADWLDAAKVDVGDPMLRAWVAWLSRDMAELDAALGRAPDSAMRRWLMARQAMLSGDLGRALELLGRADFDANETWTCAWYSRGDWDGPVDVRPAGETASERGALLLSTGENVQALRAFAEAGHWFDTAYVAERVVDVDTLKAQVDGDLLPLLPEDQREQLRSLLGRRLFRAGRLDEARTYLSGDLAQKVVRYGELVASGTAPDLWEAAKLLRFDGMELSGTELGPDFGWSGGGLPPIGFREVVGEGELHSPTAVEKTLSAEHAPRPDDRFHYRYQAAELAWQAAERIPKGHPEAPRVLCQAGRWLMHRDPDAADRFYKEMVWRGWGTPLGQTADLLRWFPDAEMCALETVTVDDAPDWWGWLGEQWKGLTGG